MDTKSFGGRIAGLIRRTVFSESHAEVVHNSEQAPKANPKGSSTPLSAVFVGCARSAAPHLSRVLANIERLSKYYGRVAFVFVENDSTDSTKSKLKRWLRDRSNGHLLELDGLAARLPARTHRIAQARNAYIDFLKSDFEAYQHLVVFDFDDVNANEIDMDGFASAVAFLESDAAVQGVFANSRPVYYDIWALRHESWCPSDCWEEVRDCRSLTYRLAVERFVYSRQIPIASDSPPIPVQSAFGGLGVYRLPAALTGRYRGLTENGLEICEHVAFNRDVSRRGQLYIYPALRNTAPPEHLGLNPSP